MTNHKKWKLEDIYLKYFENNVLGVGSYPTCFLGGWVRTDAPKKYKKILHDSFPLIYMLFRPYQTRISTEYLLNILSVSTIGGGVPSVHTL